MSSHNRNQTWQDKRIGFLTLSISSFVFALYFLFLAYTDNYGIRSDDIYTINNLVISQTPKLEIRTSNRASKQESIIFKFQKFSKPFELSEKSIQCSNRNYLLNGFNINDTVSIIVNKSDINDLNSVNFFNKQNDLISIKQNYSSIQIVDYNCVNNKKYQELQFGYKILFSLSFLTILAYLLKKQPLFIGIKVDLSVIIALIMIILCFVL